MLSAYARNLLLDWLLSAATATRPTAWYVSLHTGDPGTTGASEVLIATDADYTRKTVSFAVAASGQKASSTDVTHTADIAATTYNVTHIGIWDAATAGNFLLGGALAVPETVVASGTIALTTGRIIGALT